MQPREVFGELSHMLRKQPLYAARDAAELRIALGKIMRAVELVQEKLRRRAHGPALQAIGIGRRETAGLKLLDGVDGAQQPVVSRLRPHALDGLQVLPDGLGVAV